MAMEREFVGSRLLLMGSKAFRAKRLPDEITERIDEGMARNMTIIVGEALGAPRLYQDYLSFKGYRNVIVGHAKTMRYNAGNWNTAQYGSDLEERERRMIEDCESAIIIWTDSSSVIAHNLEVLKRLRKPTYLYECSTRNPAKKAGWLDPKRTYDPYYEMNEVHFRRKERPPGNPKRSLKKDCY